VDRHHQLIADATAKARRLADDLERDANEMASADAEGQRLTHAALVAARSLFDALDQASSERK
jgi:hypothetical protein